MSAEPTNPQTPAPPTPPGVDEQLHGIWTKYGQSVLVAAGLVLLFYVGKVGWDYWQEQRDLAVREEFQAAKTPNQWKAFAAAHPSHQLAGVADLQIADDAYAAGLLPVALTSYQAAIPLLKNEPLATRARMGTAMCQLQSGQATEGEGVLRAIFNDPAVLPVLRTEAGYQLASRAATAGRMDEARQLATQLLTIDRGSPWTRKAFMLHPPAK